MSTHFCLITFFLILTSSSTPTPFSPRPFDHLSSRQVSQNVSGDLVVDLGYELYQGVHNESTGLNTWKGYGMTLEVKSYTFLAAIGGD